MGPIYIQLFIVSNDVRQGGILSLRSFAVYVDENDLSKHLHDARSGSFRGKCINHVIYVQTISVS